MLTLQFHWYGFWVGLGLLVGLSVAEHKLKKYQLPTKLFLQLFPLLLVGGGVGARAWHVLTDLPAYVGNWWAVLAVWRGGLSIIGAVFAGFCITALFFVWHKPWVKFMGSLLDAAAFGLPIGQAIGRLGNAANQELYGLPSRLPWAITINSAHRYPGYAQFPTYHPLFAYEAILLLIFFGGMWWLEKHRPAFVRFGSGNYFCLYILYYAWIRFGLDFIRIDKAASPVLGLGLNQVFLLIVGIMGLGWLMHFLQGKYVASS